MKKIKRVIYNSATLALILWAGVVGFCLNGALRLEVASDRWQAISAIGTFLAVAAALGISAIQRSHQIRDQTLERTRRELDAAVEAQAILIYFYSPLRHAVRTTTNIARTGDTILASTTSEADTAAAASRLAANFRVEVPEQVIHALNRIHLLGPAIAVEVMYLVSALRSYKVAFDATIGAAEAHARRSTFRSELSDRIEAIRDFHNASAHLERLVPDVLEGQRIARLREELALLTNGD